MKSKKYWIAIQIEKNGKYSAVVLPVSENDNLYTKLTGIPGIVAANVYDTRKAAAAVVRAWVEGFRAARVFKWDTMEDGSPAPF